MRSILFKEELFKAVIEGQKTQTRRIMKSPSGYFNVSWKPDRPKYKWANQCDDEGGEASLGKYLQPRYPTGSIVYLKEPYIPFPDSDLMPVYRYAMDTVPEFEGNPWKNKLFMPEKYARYFIKITGVRIERVDEISEDDAIAEGVAFTKYANASARQHFKELWASINGIETWWERVWVWVYEFELTER